MKKLIFLVFILSGCSTLTNGVNQSIKVKDDCTVVDETGVVHVLNNSATVRRSKSDLRITCDGETKIYKPSLTKEALTSMALIDFGLVDFLTGSAWEYQVDQ